MLLHVLFIKISSAAGNETRDVRDKKKKKKIKKKKVKEGPKQILILFF